MTEETIDRLVEESTGLVLYNNDSHSEEVEVRDLRLCAAQGQVPTVISMGVDYLFGVMTGIMAVGYAMMPLSESEHIEKDGVLYLNGTTNAVKAGLVTSVPVAFYTIGSASDLAVFAAWSIGAYILGRVINNTLKQERSDRSIGCKESLQKFLATYEERKLLEAK